MCWGGGGNLAALFGRFMSFKHKSQDKKIHVYIATPAYDGKCQTDFAMSLAETCQLATAYGIRVTVCMMRNSIFIDMARNHFARLFLETDATHLFFIDSDLKFEPRAVIALATAGQPVCAGLYPRRQDPVDYPARYAKHPEHGGLYVENGWVMCDRVPTGFLCIERKVIEEMSAEAQTILSPKEPAVKRLFYTYISDNHEMVGEDFAFCGDYVKKYGKFIPVWPDFDFTHGERWTGNFHDHLNSLTEAEAAAEAAETSVAA
jgi:hypothetical protein